MRYYLARQPIHNSRFEVVGYQILYVPDKEASGGGPALPPLEVVQRLTAGRTAFVGVDQNSFPAPELESLAQEKVVLQLPPDLSPDTGVAGLLAHYQTLGARIALDGFEPQDRRAQLLPKAAYVKIHLNRGQGQNVAGKIRSLGTSAQLVACGVDSHEFFETCRQWGIECFQGRFFLHPRQSGGRRPPASSLSVMQLLARLHDPDLELADVGAIIERDVSLSYRLLKYLNSVHFSLRSPIESVGHALSYLGLDHLRVWVSLLLLARLDHKPSELMKTALVRARLCQQLVDGEHGQPGAGFLLGLFSGLDALLDLPMEEVVRPLPLSDRLKRALVDFDGDEGGLLKNVLAWERGDWQQAAALMRRAEKPEFGYLEAVDWAEQVFATVFTA